MLGGFNALALASGLFAGGVGAVRISSEGGAYADFRRKYGARGGDYETRRWLFEERKAEVDRHNAQPGVLWTAAVNHFADYTREERVALLNYKRSGGAPQASASSFLDLGDVQALPEAMDWEDRTPGSSAFFRDQGHCGSCWAVAAVAAIEMHAEIQTSNATRFSAEQIIDCTPNPHHCGGDGGCQGATSQLAMAYVSEHGLALDTEYPVDGLDEQCFDATAAKVLRLDGYTDLPQNQYAPMLQAVATKGPVLVSVAGSEFFKYSSGVFDGCDADVVLNHAVILVGYGTDSRSGAKFWRIRNSWGTHWGEGGYMRLLRHTGENEHCGVDTQPEKGYACEGHPEPIDVCGMCGILAHSAHPNTITIDTAAAIDNEDVP